MNRIFLLLLMLTVGWAVCAEESVGASADSAVTEDEKPVWDVNNPPGDLKTVGIDTTETTWTSLDVSRDGQWIIFDMLGDLYRVAIGGGQAEALTADTAWNMQPRYSPDGSRIVFISDRNGADNLWVMAADGTNPQELTKERDHLFHNPAWSPDGQWIAARKGFVSTRSIPSGEIWLVHASGGKGLKVVERPGGEAAQKNIAEPAFSPDGRFLYYSMDTTPGTVWQYNKNALESVFSILRLDRQENKTVTLIAGPGGAIAPTPSPDGRWLAFVKRLPDTHSALYLMELESGNERPLYLKMERDLQETNGSHGNTPAFAWTPDSKSLVFWAGGKLRRMAIDGDADATELAVHVQADKKVRPALRFPVDVAPDRFTTKALRWAQYSPDGSKVIFQALGYLYVRDVSSGEQRRLTRQTEHFEFWPGFSADGRSVVYSTWNDQQLGSVRVVPVRGGTGKPVTKQPGHYVEPRFSPDGKYITYRKFAGGNLLSPRWSSEPGLYVVESDGANPRRVSDAGFDARFSNASDRLLYSETVDDTQLALKSVDLDGRDERVHLKGAKVTEFSLSPNGQWVAFIEHYTAYVAPFAVTGETVDIGKGSEAFPVTRIAKRSGEGLHWSGDSQTVHWSLGSTLFSRRLADAFSFIGGAPDELPEPVSEGLKLGFEVAADQPQGQLAITNAVIVTMRNAQNFEEVIQNGTILIDGPRISAVGPAQDIAIPDGARVLDAAGHTIIPGLVDVHAHGGLADNELTPQQNWAQYSNLSFGVTTIHDPSNDTTEIFSHAEMQRTGQVLGPRTWSTGTILYGALVPSFTAVIDSLDDALFHVQRLKDMGAISVKSYNQLRRDSRQQVIAAGAQLEIMVVPEGGAKFQHNLTHVVDGHTGVEHALPIANIYSDVKQLWSQTAVGYSPTFGVAYGGLSGETYWYDRTEVWKNPRLLRYVPLSRVLPGAIRRLTAPDEHYNHVLVARHALALRELGVPVVIGAHGQREGLAAHWEMWMMNQGGFTPWQAIRGATIDGARYLGMDRDVGSIEPGKLADLVLIDGNPLADIRRSEFVAYTVLNGRLYEAATLNEQLTGDFRRQPFFFEQPGGDAFPPAAQKQLEQKASRYGWRH